jgi:hypothetical protein
MGIAEFGGNGSVRWWVDIRQARTGSHWAKVDHEAGLHQQEGIEETPANGKFRISIKVPKGAAARAALVKQLQRATSAADAFTLTIPIEKHQEDQVRVRWPHKASK